MKEPEYLKGRKYTKARRLAKALGISTTQAGKMLRKLGWNYWGSSTTTKRTWVRPELKKVEK